MFGGVLNRLLGKSGNVASRLASEYGDDVLRNVATEYGDDAARSVLSNIGDSVASSAKKSKVGDALVRASDTALNAPLALGKKDMREIGPDAYEKIGKLFDRTGLTNLDDLKAFAKNLTGNGEQSFLDEATDAVRTNLGKGNIVDLNDIMPELREIRDNMSPISARLFDEADPVKKAKILKSMANDITTSATESSEKSLKRDHFNRLGRLIDERIDANINPKYMSQVYDDVANEFLHRSQVELRNGNKGFSEAYKRLAQEYAETPAEDRIMSNFRGSKKDFVDISQMIKKNDQTKGGGSFSRAVRDVPVIGRAADAFIAQPVERATQKAGEAMRKVGREFQEGTAQENLKKAAAIGAGGAGLLAAASGVGSNNKDIAKASGISGINANMTDSSQTDTSNRMSSLGGAMPTTREMDEMTVGGYTRKQLEDGYVKALMANDAKSAQAIGSIIDIMDKNETRALNLAKLNNSAKSKSTDESKKQNAISTLNTLMGVYNEGGGGQGVVGGTLTNLLNKATGGGYSPSAETYSAQSRGAAVKIIKAMGDSGQLSDRDIQAALDMLPKNTDDNKVAKKKIDNLLNILQAR